MILSTKRKRKNPVFVPEKFLETLKLTFFVPFVQPINVRHSETFTALFFAKFLFLLITTYNERFSEIQPSSC